MLAASALVAIIAMLAGVFPLQQAAPVQAAQGGCPSGGDWIGPVPSYFVIPSIDKGNFGDQNGDGYLCFRIPDGFCGNRGQGDAAPVCGAWVWKDNTNKK